MTLTLATYLVLGYFSTFWMFEFDGCWSGWCG